MRTFKVLFMAHKNTGLFNVELEVNSITTSGARIRAAQELESEGFNLADFKAPIAKPVRTQGVAA